MGRIVCDPKRPSAACCTCVGRVIVASPACRPVQSTKASAAARERDLEQQLASSGTALSELQRSVDEIGRKQRGTLPKACQCSEVAFIRP